MKTLKNHRFGARLALVLASVVLASTALASEPTFWSAGSDWSQRNSADDTLDAMIDEMNLLDANLSEDQVLELLDGMLPTDASEQPSSDASPANYVPDSRWGSNGFREDRFSGNTSGTFRAHAAVRLANGDVVVAGQINGGGVTNRLNLGLVKYNRSGQRVRWTGVPSDFGLYNSEYIRFPHNNAWGSSRNVVWVHDIKATATHFYVLLTVLQEGQRRASIIGFQHNGGGWGWNTNWPDSGTVRDAVAMDILGNHMVVLGRRSNDEGSFDGGFYTLRYRIQSNGALTFAGNAKTHLIGRNIPNDIAFRRNSLTMTSAAPAFHVAYTRSASATGGGLARAACLATIQSDDTLNASDATCYTFGNFSTDNNWAASLHTRAAMFVGAPLQREIRHMTVNYQRGRADAIGIIKWVNGTLDTSFGPQGRRLYGGCSNANVGEGCVSGSVIARPTAHVAAGVGALHADSSGVYVTGRTYRESPIVGAVPTRRPILLHVNDNNGSRISLQTIGTYPNSRFTALVPGDMGSGGVREFTVAGFAHYQDTMNVNDGPTQIIATHLAPEEIVGPTRDYTGAWYNASENGRGLTLFSAPNNGMFALWFVYDSQGRPAWYELETVWTGGDVLSGRVARWTGAPWGPNYDPAAREFSVAGTYTLTFTSASAATFSYNVDGVQRQISLTKML